jgi:hypothetical protein
VEIAVYQAPRIHGIAPSVALPGEEVTLAGTDWGAGAIVRFGGAGRADPGLSPTSIRVRVPATNQPDGTRLPVVVSMGGDPSNELPFFLGRLPLMMSVEPRTVRPGDPLVIKGMGFALQPSANDLRVGGTRAVVVKPAKRDRGAGAAHARGRAERGGAARAGQRPRGAEHADRGAASRPHRVPLRGRAPLRGGHQRSENGHDHVVLSTGLGPAFLISAAEGVSAAERAGEAAPAEQAAVALKAALTTDLEVRGLEGRPSIGMVGKQEPLLVVTADDAAAYDEDWARGKRRART